MPKPLKPTYGSITADVQATIKGGILYERTGHVSKPGRWRRVKDDRATLEAVCGAWDESRQPPTPEAYRAACLLSCLNGRDNMWRLTPRSQP